MSSHSMTMRVVSPAVPKSGQTASNTTVSGSNKPQTGALAQSFVRDRFKNGREAVPVLSGRIRAEWIVMAWPQTQYVDRSVA
ncbi:MAG: hypothetical protein HUU20_11475 [Pirellulales bacterium]|nr:hypothetical protein [Pirellulales bacterium]